MFGGKHNRRICDDCGKQNGNSRRCKCFNRFFAVVDVTAYRAVFADAVVTGFFCDEANGKQHGKQNRYGKYHGNKTLLLFHAVLTSFVS